jgi:hypothetical protein
MYSSTLSDHPYQANTLELATFVFVLMNKNFFRRWSSGYYAKRDNRFILRFRRNVLPVSSGRLNLFQVDAEASTSAQDISRKSPTTVQIDY